MRYICGWLSFDLIDFRDREKKEENCLFELHLIAIEIVCDQSPVFYFIV